MHTQQCPDVIHRRVLSFVGPVIFIANQQVDTMQTQTYELNVNKNQEATVRSVNQEKSKKRKTQRKTKLNPVKLISKKACEVYDFLSSNDSPITPKTRSVKDLGNSSST